MILQIAGHASGLKSELWPKDHQAISFIVAVTLVIAYACVVTRKFVAVF